MEVLVQGSLLMKPIRVRALVANNSPKTQISRRLAQRLGLIGNSRATYVKEALGLFGDNSILKWQIAVQSITIRCKEAVCQRFPVLAQCNPLINGNQNDAWWEMIIGTDVLREFPILLNMAINLRGYHPTPGPSHPGSDSNVDFMGHNVTFASVHDLPSNLDEYLEYNCAKSSAVARLALNKRNRQLIVIYTNDGDDERVYRYGGVPKALEQAIEDAIFSPQVDGRSLGAVMQQVRDSCSVSIIDEFPTHTVVIDWDKGQVLPGCSEINETLSQTAVLQYIREARANQN
jgi:hypothetical protein